MPLRGLDREAVLTEFVDSGFEAIIIAAKADLFGEDWLGRRIDRDTIKDLKDLQRKCSLDLCAGECHTLVVDGPVFAKRLKILESRKGVEEEFRVRWWRLEILKYTLEEIEGRRWRGSTT